MVASHRGIFGLFLALSAACEGAPADLGASAEPTTEDWADPTSMVLDLEVEPFDVRWVRLDPEAHLEQERLCDVSFVGTLRPLAFPTDRYPFAASHHGLIRCRAVTGEAWADLVFRPEAAALAPFVVAGKRIRVRVAGAHGFRDHVVVEFIAVVSDAAPSRPTTAPVAISAGANFERLFDEDVHDVSRPCSIAHAGAILPLPEEGSGRYPADATHRMVVACRHVMGWSWLDVSFTEENRARMLQMTRGEVVPLVLTGAAGLSTHPIAKFSGPSAGAS